MSDTPDYAAIVSLFPVLRNLVDACGEVTLTAEEAQRIQSLGFAARAGPWKVPPVPPELVRDNPLLEHLSIGWDSRQNDASSIPIRATDTNMKDSTAAVQHLPAREVETHGRYRMIYKPISASRQAQATGGDDSEVPALASKILAVVERTGREMTKRSLQQRFWRYGAGIFNQALGYLVRRGRITLYSKS